MPSTDLKDPRKRLRVIFESTTPLVIMETVEELRAISIVRAAAGEVQLPVFEWSVAEGLIRTGFTAPPEKTATAAAQPPAQRNPPTSVRITSTRTSGAFGVIQKVNAAMMEAGLPLIKDPGMPAQQAANVQGQPIGSGAVYNTREAPQVLSHLLTSSVDAVYVLKDLHRHMQDAVVVRLLREVAQEFGRGNRRTLVLTAPAIDIPAELQNLVEFLELPLPDRIRLLQIVEEQYNRLGATRTLKREVDDNTLGSIAGNLTGLTEEEAERSIAQAMMTRYGLFAETVTDVLDAKRDMLKRNNVLDFIPVSEDMSNIGGLENLKTWLQKRKGVFGPAARAAGIDPPKGVVIMGVQGCGKSLCARAIAGEWRLPLLKFDSSSIFDKYIGETEKRVKRLFMVAEQMAPCILWIDEMEKIFAGSGADSASSDAGTSSRLLGAFLSWMQDKRQPVFVAATSNNVQSLPPELIRKGRFDELFFVDLPNWSERKAIFELQLRKRKQDPAKFDLDKLIGKAAGYSGAEIDAAVQAAQYAAYSDGGKFTTDSVLEELSSTVPLSLTRSEDIQALREWARTRAVPASKKDE